MEITRKLTPPVTSKKNIWETVYTFFQADQYSGNFKAKHVIDSFTVLMLLKCMI